jgi:predicted RNA-binding Zn-ribbon protein involved in translation (DUF1610 family)
MHFANRASSEEEVSSEKLRFFCDNCGVEVAREAQSCHGCGKSFASVRCPACGFSGSLDRFKDSCPACGYSVHDKAAQEKKAGASESVSTQKSHEPTSESLPLWVYLVTGLALIGTLTVLFFTFQGSAP